MNAMKVDAIYLLIFLDNFDAAGVDWTNKLAPR